VWKDCWKDSNAENAVKRLSKDVQSASRYGIAQGIARLVTGHSIRLNATPRRNKSKKLKRKRKINLRHQHNNRILNRTKKFL
jgi:uncharacterized NAD(P)/FAD-binding protein YdhS